jgi:hypothetical protein
MVAVMRQQCAQAAGSSSRSGGMQQRAAAAMGAPSPSPSIVRGTPFSLEGKHGCAKLAMFCAFHYKMK